MTEESIRARVHSLRQAIESHNEKASLDHGFALFADTLIIFDRIAAALEKLAKKA